MVSAVIILQEGMFRRVHVAAVGHHSEKRSMTLKFAPPLWGPVTGMEVLRRSEKYRITLIRG